MIRKSKLMNEIDGEIAFAKNVGRPEEVAGMLQIRRVVENQDTVEVKVQHILDDFIKEHSVETEYGVVYQSSLYGLREKIMKTLENE